MSWAILSDLSGVLPVPGAIHPTEQAALEAQILHIESNISEHRANMAKAKARLRRIKRRKPNVEVT